MPLFGIGGTVMFGPVLLSLIAAAAEEVPLKTIEDRLAEFGEVARERLEPHFRAAGLPYPPSQITLVGLNRNAGSTFMGATPVERSISFALIQCSRPAV